MDARSEHSTSWQADGGQADGGRARRQPRHRAEPMTMGQRLNPARPTSRAIRALASVAAAAVLVGAGLVAAGAAAPDAGGKAPFDVAGRSSTSNTDTGYTGYTGSTGTTGSTPYSVSRGSSWAGVFRMEVSRGSSWS